MKQGKVYLIPNVIAENTQAIVIPPHVTQVLPRLKYFLAEDVRTARRYFSRLNIFPSIEALEFQVLNKDTNTIELPSLFAPVFASHDIGIVSDAGCPGVADPGALAVRFAHDHNIQVVPLVGPSSLLLALMGSGLNGQRFAFHGYLPIDKAEFAKVVRELEKDSRKNAQTQIFIETPYRSDSTLKMLLQILQGNTQLSVASSLTSEQESILTLSVARWKTKSITYGKVPAVFSILAV